METAAGHFENTVWTEHLSRALPRQTLLNERIVIMSETEINLNKAIAGEAKARLDYTAFAMQAMQEGRPEIAQLFMEAAGAETIHGISHLRVAGGIGSTLENLDHSANGEDDEIEVMYPGFILTAEAEGRGDAAASFRLALEREKHHRAMFKEALKSFEQMKATA